MSERFDGTLFGDDQPCFGCGPRHPIGFHLAFEPDGDEVVSRFTPGEAHQGAPGLMHGGLLATVADEVAAWAIVLQHGKFGFTTSFEARYRKGVRVGVPLEARARTLGPPRRLVDVGVRISQEGDLAFEATLKFAVLGRDAAEKLLGQELPEGWRKYVR